jgi:hypothetical protein
MRTLREQMKICKANGNLIECDISKMNLYFASNGAFIKQGKFVKQDIALICIKHKCQCWGGACKEERNENV